MRRAALFAITLFACRTEPAPSPPTVDAAPSAGETSESSDEAFAVLAKTLLDEHLAAHPERGVELGRHRYDGKVSDASAAGLATETKRLAAAIDSLEAIEPSSLTTIHQVERTALLAALEDDRFRLEVLRAPQRNPMFYLGALDLTPYISRDYAPLADRARAIIAIAKATPAHLAAAKTNLEASLPRTFIDTALLQTRGTATFVREDVAAAMQALPKDALAKELSDALEQMATALDAYAGYLDKARAGASDEFALGRETFARMLLRTQGIDVDLERLREVLEADLTRNYAAMEAAAREIDEKRSVSAVVAKVAADKPKPSAVLAEATTQARDMRAFLLAQDIITIPSEDVAEVVETPPFMRWNAAFLSGAGVFETKPLPSFYYISPPDPSWSKKKQRAYVPGKTDLLFITIHEVWPGHFLHGLHLKVGSSEILKSLWNYTTGEGWAHYTEEMMWDAGISEDPRVHVGQLQNALLRNVRAISALGLHTEGWTVEQSKAMFLDKAFQDEANAEQQAVRGTFDPMYLAYTTGKLVIAKMRRDLEAKAKAEGKEFSVKAFHDELLSYGAAPLSAIRAAMVPDDPTALL